MNTPQYKGSIRQSVRIRADRCSKFTSGEANRQLIGVSCGFTLPMRGSVPLEGQDPLADSRRCSPTGLLLSTTRTAASAKLATPCIWRFSASGSPPSRASLPLVSACSGPQPATDAMSQHTRDALQPPSRLLKNAPKTIGH